MVLTKALILKGVIGATSVVVPASLMITYRKEISSYFSPSNLTKFDQGLIDYLDNGGDIQFKVIKGETDLDVNGLTFSGNNPITISAKIKVTKEESNDTGTLTDGTRTDNQAKKAELQKLNGDGTNDGTAWTWICEIQLTKGAEYNTTTTIKEEYKNRILKSTNEGLFGILKEASGDGNNKKETKKKFIRNCAEVREKTNNLTGNKLETPNEKIKINFKKKDDGTELVPENSSEFDKWFPQTPS